MFTYWVRICRLFKFSILSVKPVKIRETVVKKPHTTRLTADASLKILAPASSSETISRRPRPGSRWCLMGASRAFVLISFSVLFIPSPASPSPRASLILTKTHFIQRSASEISVDWRYSFSKALSHRGRAVGADLPQLQVTCSP